MHLAPLGALVACLGFVACKSDDGSDGAGGVSSGGSAGTTGGGGTGAGGVANNHPPKGCFNRPSQCNPLTNTPCQGGEACDVLVAEDGGPELVCFPPPNLQPVGAPCHYDDGPWCTPELHCQEGRCVRFCCTNADCADAGVCVPFDPNNGTLGTCPLPPDGGT